MTEREETIRKILLELDDFVISGKDMFRVVNAINEIGSLVGLKTTIEKASKKWFNLF